MLLLIHECRAGAKHDLGTRFTAQRARKVALPPEQWVRIGDWWRSREGRLWDIIGEESSDKSTLLFVYEVGTREPRKVMCWCTGRAFEYSADR